MNNEQLKKFASELKAAREEKGISIKDIHAQTRIDTRYLEALEDGDYSIMPEVYIRAFIREYAAEVGLDVEETLRKYDLAKSGSDFSRIEESEEKEREAPKIQKTDFGGETKSDEPERNNKKNPMLFYGGIGAAVLIVLLILIFSGGGDEEIIVENKYQAPKTEATIEKSESRKSTAEKKKSQEKASAPISEPTLPINPFVLKLTGVDTVWVRAKIDEKRTEEFMLYPDISRTIEVNSIANVLIGNAAGVEIFIDGNKIDFSGEKGKVRNLILTKDGIQKKKRNVSASQ
jgi:cytoskeletal protein RodZ